MTSKIAAEFGSKNSTVDQTDAGIVIVLSRFPPKKSILLQVKLVVGRLRNVIGTASVCFALGS